MLFLLGILSIFQITTLPGILILKVIELRGSFIQRMVYTFALSLIFNYCIAFTLATLGLYNRWSLFLIFAFEIGAILWLYRNEFSEPILPVMQGLNDSLLNTIQIIFLRGEAQEVKPNLLDTLLILGSLGLATSSILWVFRIFIYNLGTVFDAWDTIISWNNWQR